MLDDLYWVMSYSRWKDDRYWPAFRDALLQQHPSLTEAVLQKAREFNAQRYHFQGIGRYAPDAAFARGLADLGVLADGDGDVDPGRRRVGDGDAGEHPVPEDAVVERPPRLREDNQPILML